MSEGPYGGALRVVQPRWGEIPLSNGASNGEDSDLKDKEHAPQQGDIGEGDERGNPGVCLPDTAVHRGPFCVSTLPRKLSCVPVTCRKL